MRDAAAPRRAILFTDIGDTVIDEGTEVRDAPGGVVRRAACVPGARETLLALYARGYTIAMVADGLVESFHNTMAQHGLDHVFAAKAISEAVGAEKPDPRMFLDALQKCGHDAKDTVFIDDNPKNLEGAAKFGITPILITAKPGSDVESSYATIHSLSELL